MSAARQRAAASALALSVALAPHGASAADPQRMPSPLDHLGPNVARAFTGENVFLYASAVAATAVLAVGGGDAEIRRFAQTELHAPVWGDLSYAAGYVLPLVIAPGVYALGVSARDRTLAGAGAAATQALGVTLLTTGVLKWATGRPFPNHGGDPNDPARLAHDEYARELGFDPRNTRDFAWPSGHTSATICIAAALTAYYPEERWIPFVGYPVALGIGLGMVAGDHHWMSDVVAGAFIGHAIGWSIGHDFQRSVREGGDHGHGFVVHFAPLVGARVGLSAAAAF